MSAGLSIEKPTVVVTLPRSIDHSAGRYVISEVHGGVPGSRKRKRSELVVGVDGEGLNIYDTKSSKLVASYALPPQSSFTCPPCSVRLKYYGENGIERRTYVSTQNTTSSIILFRDTAASNGTTQSLVEEKTFHARNKPVTFLSTLPEDGNGNREDLLLIRKDGEIQLLDGINLETRWTSPASSISKSATKPDAINHEVRFAKITDAHTASKRLLKGREDIVSIFTQGIDTDRFNTPILILITSPQDPALAFDRKLHVVKLPSKTGSDSIGGSRSVHFLLSVSLPVLQSDVTREETYNLHVASGVLHVLGDQYLTTFDLSDWQPKIQSQIFVGNAKSFLPLSRTSIITASTESINIYNRTFQSIQASVSLKSTLYSNSKKRKIGDEDPALVPNTCTLVAYSEKQSLVYAIASNDLIVLQVGSRQNISHRHGALGLLRDALGCGVRRGPNMVDESPRIISLGTYTRSSEPTFEMQMSEKFSELDRFVVEEDVEGFEKIMATELGIKRDVEELDKWKREQQPKKVNGVVPTTNGLNDLSAESTVGDAKPVPRWVWPDSKTGYPEVDPRFIQYALSRIFSWRSRRPSSEMEESETSEKGRLVITFFPHNVVHWLIETGNLNHGNVQLALRHDAQISMTQTIPAGQIVGALVDVDPGLTMLLALVSSTHLDAAELIHAIRLLMQSLELLGGAPNPEEHLLTNGEAHESANGELEAEIEIEQDKAATALGLAESYLGDSPAIRGRVLSLALLKLHGCAEAAVVAALRSILTPAEIVSLIYLLRFELVRGSWTSRYLDTYEPRDSEDEAGQDNTILHISGLLNCCIDAIGAGGWLSGGSMLFNGDHLESEELIVSLKLEVSAALEGIEEASYLKGLIAEMVRYGEGVQKGLRASEKSRKANSSKWLDTRPITLPQVGREARLLPFGLKGEKQISRYRVGPGGEIQQRTTRDIGRLKSRRVGKYSRESIVI